MRFDAVLIRDLVSTFISNDVLGYQAIFCHFYEESECRYCGQDPHRLRAGRFSNFEGGSSVGRINCTPRYLRL